MPGERGRVYPPARAGMRMLSSAMDSTRTTAPSSRNLAQTRDLEGDVAVGRPLSRGGESPASISRSLLEDNHAIGAGSGSSPTSPSTPSLSSVFYFSSLHSSVINAQNSVLPSKQMELSKSKNRKVDRFALCQTDFTSG